jgi:hypothetical protein
LPLIWNPSRRFPERLRRLSERNRAPAGSGRLWPPLRFWWHDWTVASDISDDGKVVSFDESGEAGGDTGAFYVRGTDGSPAVRLGEGLAPALSRDGKQVLALLPGPNGRRNLVEIPTGAGVSHAISTGNVQVHGAYLSRTDGESWKSAARRDMDCNYGFKTLIMEFPGPSAPKVWTPAWAARFLRMARRWLR